MEPIRTVIASGGGMIEGNDHLINCYLLAQTKKTIPKVLLIPTASGDHSGLIEHYKNVWSQYPCDPSVLSFFHGSVPDLSSLVLSQDLIVVSGGNSKSLLGVWREWGLDKVLRQAYEKGIILAGGSAGAVCWFREALTDSFKGCFSKLPCLDFLPFSCCPHYSLKSRRIAYKHSIDSDELIAGYAITDHTSLHFQNEKLLRGVSPFANQSAHYVEKKDDRVIGTPLVINALNDKNIQDELILSAPCFSYLNEKETSENSTTTTYTEEGQVNV